jgi:hypothetical protein
MLPAVHTNKEQPVHGAHHHHQTAAEQRARSSKRVLFIFQLLSCLLFNSFDAMILPQEGRGGSSLITSG